MLDQPFTMLRNSHFYRREHALFDLDLPSPHPRKPSPKKGAIIKGFVDLDEGPYYEQIVDDIRSLFANAPILAAVGLPTRWTISRGADEREVILALDDEPNGDVTTEVLQTFLHDWECGVRRARKVGAARWRLRLESAR